MLLTWEEYNRESHEYHEAPVVKIKTEFFKEADSDKWFNVSSFADVETSTCMVVQNYIGNYSNTSKKKDTSHIRNSVKNLIMRKIDEGYEREKDSVNIVATTKQDVMTYFQSIGTNDGGMEDIAVSLLLIDKIADSDQLPSPVEPKKSNINDERLAMNKNWGAW